MGRFRRVGLQDAPGLVLRAATAGVAIPLALAIAWNGGWLFDLCVAAAAIVGAYEFWTMLRASGHRPILFLSIAVAVAFLWQAISPASRALPFALAVAAVAAAGVLLPRTNQPGALADWALTFAPGIYVGGLLQFGLLLRDVPDGRFWVVTVMIATWMADTFAYLAGRVLGSTRLARGVSPGKTVEGAAAGVVAAILVGLLAALLADHPFARLAGLGLTVGVCSILGDLVESFFKRQCGVKDSGGLFPGHGGLLDRIDSLMLAGAGAYLYVAVT